MKIYEYVYVASDLRTRIAFPNYELARVLQHELHPWTVANPSLDSGCPHSLFKPKNEVCMTMKSDDTNRAWTRYNKIQHTDTNKGKTSRAQIQQYWGLHFLACDTRDTFCPDRTPGELTIT